MSKRIALIENDMKIAAEPKVDNPSLKNAIKKKQQVDKLDSKKSADAAPKDNASVFASKPEPNRGAGDDRHPSTAKAHVTRPTMEGRENEYNANLQLSSKKTRVPGHYLVRNGNTLNKIPHPTAQHALNAYHALSNKEGVKIHHVKEETITELSKKTMGSYVAKAAADAADKASEGGWKHAKSQDDGLDDGEKEDKKAFKRLQGIKKAAKKLSEDGADKAGDYIHDFVHSKNKKFSGDSKKQRIKRALGAYYAKNEAYAPSLPNSYDVTVHDHSGNPVKVHKNVKANDAKHAVSKISYKHPEGYKIKAGPVSEEFAAGIGNTQTPRGITDKDETGNKLPKKLKKIKEDAAGMSIGSGAISGITDPTTNYAFEVEKKKKNLKQIKTNMVRRKKPVGE